MISLLTTAQKAVLVAFTSATIVFSALSVYTVTNYIGVFHAVRMLQLSMSDFTFEITDETHAIAKTNLNLSNASPYEFYVTLVEQQVYLNELYAGTARAESLSSSNPMRLAPQSTANCTLILNLYFDFLSPEIIELLLNSSSKKSWYLFINAALEGPIVGKFDLDLFQEVSA